jgi:nucleoside-diphosphate-sugar epimerase
VRTRPYIHVSDAANVASNIISRFGEVKNNVFNVGFKGENYEKIRIAEAVKEHVPELNIKVVDKGIDVRDYQVDFSKLEEHLGVKKNFTVEDGIREVLNLRKTGTIKDPMDAKYYNTSPDLSG